MILLLLGCEDAAPAHQLTLLSPPDGVDVDGVVDVVAEWAGGVALGTTTLELDGGDVLLTGEGAVTSGHWNAASAAPGWHILRAYDTTRIASDVHRVATGELSARTLAIVPSHGDVGCGARNIAATLMALGATVEVVADGEALGVGADGRFAWTPDSEGEHDVIATATLAGEIVAQDAVVFTSLDDPDCAQTSVKIGSPPPSWVANGTVAVVVTPSSEVAVERVDIVLDGALLTSGAGGSSFDLDSSVLSDGWHRLEAIATDSNAGQARDAVVFALDRVPPTLLLDQPAEGAVTTGSSLAVSATASDAFALASVEVTVDGDALCSSETGVLSCSWTPGAAASGTHELVAQATDRAGNTTTQAANFVLDRAPQVEILSPANGERVESEATVAAIASDDVAFAELTIEIDGVQVANSAESALDVQWDACAVDPGEHVIRAVARDDHGSEAETEVRVSTHRTLSIEVREVAGDFAKTNAIYADTETGWPVYMVEWSIDGAELGLGVWGEDDRAACATGCADGCATWSLAPNLDGLSAGTYTLTARATSVDGESVSSSTTVTLTGDVDEDGGVAVRFGGDDCDDGDASVFVGAEETCNEVDDDCDGAVDEDFDADVDGYQSIVCATGADCDDDDASVHPAASEVCDGIDNDCDGTTDHSADSWATTAITALADTTESVEANYGTTEFRGLVFEVESETILRGASATLTSTTATEVGWALYESVALDEDFSIVGTVMSTERLSGEAESTTDTVEVTLSPGRFYVIGFWTDDVVVIDRGPPEIVEGLVLHGAATDTVNTNAYEQDLQVRRIGVDDSWAPVFSLELERIAAVDADEDGDGTSAWCGDCDDIDASSVPGAVEGCDGMDNDCDGVVLGEEDADADGVRVCASDCDDANPSRYPGHAEECDGVDNDCDAAVLGEADADADGVRECAGDCDDTDPSVGAEPWFADADGDGYGNLAYPSTSCPAPSGYVANDDDCDDDNPNKSPAAAESCNGEDDDCDGLNDEDWPDADADAYASCLDCDDAASLVNPGATEVCGDATDDDCDGHAPTCGLSGSTGMPAGSDVVLEGVESGESSGWWLASGDVDADGIEELLVGAPDNDDGGSGAGVVYVVDPAPGTWDVDDWGIRLIGDAAGDEAGTAFAVSPDLTGDGIPDTLVGAPLADPGGASRAGAAYIVAGPVTGDVDLATGAFAQLTGGDSNDYAGWAVAALGDSDGDGVGGFAVGAPSDEGSGAAAGTVYVGEGLAAGAATLTTFSALYGEGSGAEAGSAVANAKDMDGDGLDDLLVGAYNYGYYDVRSPTYLVLGGSGLTGSLAGADARWVGEDFATKASFAVAGAGDLNGDGLADAAVGAPESKAEAWYGGTVFIMYGPGTAVTELSAGGARIDGATDYALVGSASVGPGDVDDDGVGDLLVGAYGQTVLSSTYSGAAYLLYGPISGSYLVPGDGAAFTGESYSNYLGWSLAAGDFDADGYPDLAMGAYGNDGGKTDAGSTYVLLMGP